MDELPRKKKVAFAAVVLVWFPLSSTNAEPCPNPTVVGVYTTNADFNPTQAVYHPGDPVHNNTRAVLNRLCLREEPGVLPFIWVACSQRGTVVRIATEEHYSPIHGRIVQRGEILGEYWTAPQLENDYPSVPDPSRTTVDFDGSVWVANRDDVSTASGTTGHVVKIGTGLAYQWIDRNENGQLDTSTGLGDILDWDNDDERFSEDDIAYATDELILLYRPVPATGLRTVAVNHDNNV